jgi:hypothetical protein
MLITDLITIVKTKLSISDTTKDQQIKDIIDNVLLYCNITKYPIEYLAELDGITKEAEYAKIQIPIELEPFIRKKLKTIIDYEAIKGTDNVFDLKSISEGDTSKTYNIEEVSKETVYGFSDKDKTVLNAFRRLRW